MKPATPEIVALLLTTKVKVIIQELPLELMERPHEEDAEPISMDDVLDLGLNLRNEESTREWMDRLMGRKNDDD